MKNIVQRMNRWKKSVLTLLLLFKRQKGKNTQKESNLAESTAIGDDTRFIVTFQSTSVKKQRYCYYKKRLCTFRKG